MEQDSLIQHEDGHTRMTGTVRLPAATVWPMVLALGIALMLAGMVTHWVISLLGLLLAVRAAWGWFFQVLPHEHHIYVPVQAELLEIASTRTAHERLPEGAMHRKLIPIETFSITAGIKGGIAGGFAMTVPAGIFSVVRYHSFWYAANLLAAGGFVSWAGKSDAFLGQFHLVGFLAATAIHGLASILIGLLYGAMLPMFPRKPILTCGFVAPFLWTGILYSAIGVISPILDQRIDWLWFVVSQIAFGLVCGYVVNRQVKVRTAQFRALPFSVRAGLHGDPTAGYIHTSDDPDDTKAPRKTTSNDPGLTPTQTVQHSDSRRNLHGCTWLQPHPRSPGPGPEVLRPEQVLDFPTLYKQNCAACHGETGKNGAALPLNNPVYLAITGESNIQRIIANGVSGKLMPPFAKSAGGTLTDQQVAALAQGIMQTWGTPNLLAGPNPPPYAATQPGDAARGQQVFSSSCARCHGATGEGNQTVTNKLGSIVDPSYLALISDQALRSIIIAGLPDRNMPDWRTDSTQPLTDQQITDIVAWLASKRSANPGQPYPETKQPAGAAQ